MSEEATAESLLERLRPLSHRPAAENITLIRSLTTKLHARLTGQDLNVRQSTLDTLWKLDTGNISLLIVLLESCRDSGVGVNLAGILRETICLKSGKGKANKARRKAVKKKSSVDISTEKCHEINVKLPNSVVLSPVEIKPSKNPINDKKVSTARQAAILQTIEQNSIITIIRVLLQIQSKKETNDVNVESYLYDILWVLSQLSQKDPKFCIKARMLGIVKLIHNLLRININNNKIIFPLLNLMKQLSKHPITTAILARDGVIVTYEKVLISLGFLPTARMRLCLDSINYFSRNKTCCIQLVKAGVIHILLRVFDRWDKYEGKMRIKLCTHILQTLYHICIIKSGRRTIAIKKHVQILQRFCHSCPDEDIFDRLLGKVCSILCLCINSKTLPVSSSSPATFCLTKISSGDSFYDNLDYKTDDFAGSSSEEETAIEDDEHILSKDNSDTGTDSDCAQDESFEKESKNCTDLLTNSSNFIFQSLMRDFEELKRYNHLFKEFTRLQKQLRLIRGSKANILEDSGSNISSSDFNISKTEHSNLIQGNSICSLKILRDPLPSNTQEIYINVASKVKSIIPFVKVAYPNLCGGDAFNKPEYLNYVERSTCRKKLISCVERAINPDSVMNEVVYDLDSLCSGDMSKSSDGILSNCDLQKLTNHQYLYKKLDFESRFESGNLRKVIQTGPREYDLILMPDVNSTKRHLWFYFEVSNMSSNGSYVFNIVNCEKSDSQFNFGMKPVMYSVKEATLGRPGWVRAGSDICYYRNSYQCYKNKVPTKSYLTVTFTIDFPHSNDVCYLAYHFPYTYSQMMTKIWLWSQNLPPNVYFRAEPLCSSLNNNEVPLLTITGQETINNPIQDREIIFLTSRVHPGESNASWVMEGTLKQLLDNSSTSEILRLSYVFKIVPMLNVEGVINGCYRCGLTNEDLNRRWSRPSPILHPDIYHTKGLLEYMSRALKKPASVYCDFHGHSRKKNVFLYGCSPQQSWCSKDAEMTQPDGPLNYLCLPAAMHHCCPSFSLGSCSFKIEREREATARVTVWRQLGVQLSYTLETSFCGFDQGPYKGLQLNTGHLKEIGKDLCTALATLKETSPADLYLTTDENGYNPHFLNGLPKYYKTIFSARILAKSINILSVCQYPFYASCDMFKHLFEPVTEIPTVSWKSILSISRLIACHVPNVND
ncbi:cytosolic carboxypeptidase 1-like [Arctopsyche grandis]|uniref:cytosolic carboxypeptidase 1-like n=1 Tax=Arctopsyche grandis TaxID=121162 RepID=UPI00406DA3C8